MTSGFSFASWPPVISEEELEALTLYATTFALSHGLLYLPPSTPHPPAPTSAIHAPLSLFPSPFPRHLFKQAQKLQRPYNVLYARVTMDTEFLDRVMGAEQGVGKVDEFVGQLWKHWKSLRDEGPLAQPLHLGLFRSDYLLHQSAQDGKNLVSLKQVEFNTISSSFGPLSERAAALHRYLLATTRYYNKSQYLKEENFPPNNTTAGLAEGLAEAHKAYGVPEAYILFVVQAGERNVFDQRWLEYELLEKYSIRVIRQTFRELSTSLSIDPINKALYISPPPGLLLTTSRIEVSIVYFRAGYTPSDYPTTKEYTTRLELERSRAIQCPSIPLQLAGGKKVQEVLTNPGVLESFLCDEEKWGPEVFSKEVVEEVRASWMGMWGLDHDEDQEAKRKPTEESLGMRRARENALSLVLKPQREGGGNNVYKSDIPAVLDALPPQEQAAWIAMDLIISPEDAGNYLVRAGGGTGGSVRTDVISELGIFGWALFGGEGKNREQIREKEVGWLVRTKGKESNEGGVAAGFSVLDSVVLVDN